MRYQIARDFCASVVLQHCFLHRRLSSLCDSSGALRLLSCWVARGYTFCTWVTVTKCSLKHAGGLWSRNPWLKCGGSIRKPHSNYCCQRRELHLVGRCSHCSRKCGEKSWHSCGVNSLHFLLVNSCSWLDTVILQKQTNKQKTKGIRAWTFICPSKYKVYLKCQQLSLSS